MFKKRLKKFILYRIIFFPLQFGLGFLSSLLVIRKLGTDVYATIAVVNSFIGVVSAFSGAGVMPTVTKFWIEADTPNKKANVIMFSIFYQSVLIVFVVLILLFIPNFTKFLVGKEIYFLLPSKIIIAILISIIIETISTGILTALLDNKWQIMNSMLATIVLPVWYLVVVYYSLSKPILVLGIVYLKFILSFILAFGVLTHIKSKKGVFPRKINLSFQPDWKFLRRITVHASTISLLSILKMLSSPSVPILVLNKISNSEMVSYFSISSKFVQLIAQVIGIPTYKSLLVYLSQAIKEKKWKQIREILKLISNYYCWTYSIVILLGLFVFDGMIKKIYGININFPIFGILLVGTFINRIFSLPNQLVEVYGLYKLLLIGTFCSFAYIAILYGILPSKIGVLGVIIGSILSFTPLYITSLWAASKTFSIGIHINKTVILILCISLLLQQYSMIGSLLIFISISVLLIKFKPSEEDRILLREVISFKKLIGV